MLQLGTYQTRIGRIVELTGSEIRTKYNLDRSERTVTVWTGKLFQANGRDVESLHEWEENTPPVPTPPGWAMGSFVQQSAVEGVPHQFDLVTFVNSSATAPAPGAVAGQTTRRLV